MELLELLETRRHGSSIACPPPSCSPASRRHSLCWVSTPHTASRPASRLESGEAGSGGASCSQASPAGQSGVTPCRTQAQPSLPTSQAVSAPSDTDRKSVSDLHQQTVQLAAFPQKLSFLPDVAPGGSGRAVLRHTEPVQRLPVGGAEGRGNAGRLGRLGGGEEVGEGGRLILAQLLVQVVEQLGLPVAVTLC